MVQNLVTEYLPTAIATFIEPMWILLNRILCLLQPLEELRTSRARASKSLSLNYTSLPPQLVVFRALRAGHLLLAAVCAMSLLSNFLATTFAGLFFQDTILISRTTPFEPVLDSRFVSINGSSGPPANGRPIGSIAEYSGAYQGSAGDDQFLVSESNYTRNTTLPSWVDDYAMYMPFRPSGDINPVHTYQGRTRYFRAVPNCKPMEFGTDYNMTLWNADKKNHSDPGFKFNQGMPTSLFEIGIKGEDNSWARCYGPYGNSDLFGESLGRESRINTDCASGKTAAELLTALVPRINATEREQELCKPVIVLGWMRMTVSGCQNSTTAFNKTLSEFEDANKDNTLILTCQPQLATGIANISVDANGVLLDKPSAVVPDPDQSPAALNAYTSNGVENVISQFNLFIFRSQYSTWHNDSFASEYIHFFMNRAAGSLRLTDPNSPLPTFSDVEGPLNTAYARLFAIWLGLNKESLFEPAANASGMVDGLTVSTEERLFFTKPLFIISEIILGIYIVVSVLIYFWRPGRYLPYLPTSIASIIALFAASAAVKDLQGTSHMTNKEREKYLKDLDHRYGYGSYVGSDGAVHVGIEKAPYVRYMKEVTFAGSSVEREIRRRKEKVESITTSSTEYSHIPVDDAEDGRLYTAPARGHAAVGRGARDEHMALMSHGTAGERSVSPLEEVPLHPDETHPHAGAYSSGRYQD